MEYKKESDLMGGFEPTISTTIEQVPTPGQLRKKNRAALRDIRHTGKASKRAIHRTGRATRRDIRRTALAEKLPPTFLGRTAYHAGSVRDLVEVVAAIGVAAVAIRRTWQELQIRHRPEEAHNQGTESATQDRTS